MKLAQKNGKTVVQMTKEEWQTLGRSNGWNKKAEMPHPMTVSPEKRQMVEKLLKQYGSWDAIAKAVAQEDAQQQQSGNLPSSSTVAPTDRMASVNKSAISSEFKHNVKDYAKGVGQAAKNLVPTKQDLKDFAHNPGKHFYDSFKNHNKAFLRTTLVAALGSIFSSVSPSELAHKGRELVPDQVALNQTENGPHGEAGKPGPKGPESPESPEGAERENHPDEPKEHMAPNDPRYDSWRDVATSPEKTYEIDENGKIMMPRRGKPAMPGMPSSKPTAYESAEGIHASSKPKLVKTQSGYRINLNKASWAKIGQDAGWIK